MFNRRQYFLTIVIVFLCLLLGLPAYSASRQEGKGLKGELRAKGTALPKRSTGSGDPLDTWTWRNPLPQGNPLAAVTYGNGMFAAAGGGNTILTSPDGTTWTTRHSGTVEWLQDITFGNNTFVAVGSDAVSGPGVILTSADGITWSRRNPAGRPQEMLYGVAFGNNTFVAVGDGGISTSPDGIVWTLVSGVTVNLIGITFGNNAFVTVGQGNKVFTSPDGTVWSSGTTGTANALSGLAFGNNTYVAVGTSGTILTSPDGTTWSPVVSGTTRNLSRVIFSSNTFLAVGDSGTILASTDGTTWSPVTSGTTNDLTGVTFANNTFVVVGGRYYRATILTSPDGAVWTSKISGTTDELDGAAFGNNTFVATGQNGTILASPDGTIWNPVTSGTTNDLTGAAFANNTFVTVGAGGTVLASPDGTTWSPGTSGTTNGLNGVAFGNSAFVAAGAGGTILTSADGTTWSPAVSGTTSPLYAVAFGNNTFVAVGEDASYNAVILTSPEGTTWTPRTSVKAYGLLGIAFGNSTFVAVGETSTILTSSNGVTWTPRTFWTGNNITGITFDHNTFVAVAGGNILTSPDGAEWTLRTSGTINSLHAAAFGNGTFVAVGYGGTILQSGVSTTLTVAKSGSGSGTVTSNPAGITCGAACSAGFTQGQDVTLTGAAGTGSIFAGWSGGGCSGTGTCRVTMSSDITVSATFTPYTYTLTATRSGTGSGTLLATGLSCSGSSCTGTYSYGTQVNITAKADTGSTFSAWTGCDAVSGKVCTVTMAANKAVSAAFTLNSYTLTATRTGTGTGTISGSGLSCSGSSCTGTYPYNTTVTITATASTGSMFIGWVGCDSTSSARKAKKKTNSGDTCTVAMTATRSVSASFLALPTTLTVIKSGSGTVGSSPAGIDCGTTCSATFPASTPVALLAVPDTDWAFAYWSGVCGGAAPTCMVTVGGPSVAGAAFVPADTQQYRLTTLKKKTNSGDGAIVSADGTINCGPTCMRFYYPRATITLAAKPASGSTFTGWTGACSGKETCAVTMTQAKSVQATFTGPVKLTVAKHHSRGGDGTVTSLPAGIDCGDACSAPYGLGTTVTLTAVATGSSVFSGWSGACSGKGACLVPMNRAKAVQAYFSGPVSLTVGKQHVTKGDGTVTSSPSGINCGPACNASYPLGSTVTLTAIPVGGSTFFGWRPASAKCSTGTCTVTLNGAKSVSAVFVGPQQLTVVKRKVAGGDGTITSSPSGINCGSVCTNSFAYRQSVKLTATPASGSTFAGWAPQALCRGTGACTVTMNTAKSVSATFKKKGAAEAEERAEGEH